MNVHPAGQNTVPAETKGGAANTMNSAMRAKKTFAKSPFGFIAHLHENFTHRVYSRPPIS
jgi:hypothetical protein